MYIMNKYSFNNIKLNKERQQIILINILLIKILKIKLKD